MRVYAQLLRISLNIPDDRIDYHSLYNAQGQL